MNQQERQNLRKSRIAARDALSAEERDRLSKSIVSRILASPVFRQAKTILIYKGIRGEVRLEALEEAVGIGAAGSSEEAEHADFAEKRLVYPLCISKTEMIALEPLGEDSWKDGYCGIREPVREKSVEIRPEEIDLVICPCTVFDEAGGRMGMGAGFYDRYLPRCTNAHIVAVAFEAQKADCVPMEPWDRPMELVFTEKAVYNAD
ncbi:MAG: 5-formyltetrahydrofolate cyclo-ligase [Anaerovoracaceae bacterium]|nr:5-formyltetrahydrofolate cyclo-ligase [Anaerovoracaceae bacterium]